MCVFKLLFDNLQQADGSYNLHLNLISLFESTLIPKRQNSSRMSTCQLRIHVILVSRA